MIVRDEQTSLPDCLRSTEGLFDEIIVVDTGSIDNTRDVARSFAATVVDFPWCDDFSAARNTALSNCKGDYVFWMDADEVLTRQARERMTRLIGRLRPPTLYIMKQVSHLIDGRLGFVESLSPRLFPNHQGLYWSRRVYEGLLTTARKRRLETQYIDIPIWHLGFAEQSSVLTRLLRNKKILDIELAESPEDPIALFNLALTHSRIAKCALNRNEYKQSQSYLQEILRNAPESADADLTASAYNLTSNNHFNLYNICDACRCCLEGRSLYPGDLGLLANEAFLLHDLGMWEEAKALYNRLGSIKTYDYLRQRGDKAYYNLISLKIAAAHLYEELEEYGRAFLIWADLVRNSSGMFEAVPGLRRTARGFMVNALKGLRTPLQRAISKKSRARMVLSSSFQEKAY